MVPTLFNTPEIYQSGADVFIDSSVPRKLTGPISKLQTASRETWVSQIGTRKYHYSPKQDDQMFLVFPGT